MKEMGSKQWPSSCININLQEDMNSKWQKEHGNDDDDNDNDKVRCS